MFESVIYLLFLCYLQLKSLINALHKYRLLDWDMLIIANFKVRGPKFALRWSIVMPIPVCVCVGGVRGNPPPRADLSLKTFKTYIFFFLRKDSIFVSDFYIIRSIGSNLI